MELIQPKIVTIEDKEFIISKFDAISGREIVAKYIPSILPKVGDYKVSEEVMFKMMKFVAVMKGDAQICLSTPELIKNHTVDWETLILIEMAIMEYNCRFFRNGRISTFFNDIAQKVPAWISKILTALSEQLSQKEKPPSMN